MDAAARSETPQSPVSTTQPTTSLKRKRTTSISTHDACVICLSPVSERAITVPCNHTAFDFLCLVSWLQSHPRCPSATPKSPPTCGDAKAASAPPHARSGNGAWSGARNSRPYRPRRPRNNEATVTPDTAFLRRRAVYRNKLYSLHVGSNRHSRYRDFTPASFAADSNLQSRARAFIRRELRVFEFLDPLAQSATAANRRANNAEFLLEYIIAILKTSAPKGGHAEDLLQEFLGRENARLFLHELEAWLRSPFRRLEDWDRHVQYASNIPDEVRGEDRKGATGGRRGTVSEENRDWRWRHWEVE
ncbi:hypothetical protein H2199_002058 [Coniosporium tulheliwenetii]|uniref:Uncharacterized protein n=1 Tax=Coniosporium tulheliwenetii TaxID=3383036 RepID=A0ACC2ZHR1_9PEZI|nr:hypothetical protein H2199_002058 [Cladosporium sp. JES 115]